MGLVAVYLLGRHDVNIERVQCVGSWIALVQLQKCCMWLVKVGVGR